MLELTVFRSAAALRVFLTLCIPALLCGQAVVRDVLADDLSEDLAVDVWLKGGHVIDGTGAQAVPADVGLRGDRIVAIGRFTPKIAGREINCEGLIVAPGFIDLHSHSDHVVTEPLLRSGMNYLTQGCTTQVTGNCGSGPVDVAEFYQRLDTNGTGTNIAHLIPQGAVRNKVVGNEQRAATPTEISEMQELVQRGMQSGAWGMSTGLIYVPSVYADTAELVALAKSVGKFNGFYASHIRGEGSELLASIEEAILIGRQSGVPVHVSHLKSSGQENWGRLRLAVELIERARSEGQRVTADQYPYTASSTSLEATIVPTWARSGGRPAFLKRLADQETGPRLQAEIATSLKTKREGAAIFIARYQPQPQWAGQNLAEIAQETQRPVLEVALEMLRAGDVGIVNFSMSEEDVRAAMTVPWVATASDGRNYFPDATKPHPRSYGTFPRKIGFYAIDQKVLSLEQAIYSATGLPAEILGMKDRGTLRTGLMADVVVFDPAEFRDQATFADPHQYASGLEYVFVNGVLAIHRGQATGVLAGRALRAPAAVKAQKSPETPAN